MGLSIPVTITCDKFGCEEQTVIECELENDCRKSAFCINFNYYWGLPGGWKRNNYSYYDDEVHYHCPKHAGKK